MTQGDSEAVQKLESDVRETIVEQFSLGELHVRTNNAEALCFVGIDDNVTSVPKMDAVLKAAYEILRNASPFPCSVRSNTPGTWSRAYPDQTRIVA